jgi:cytochrome c5
MPNPRRDYAILPPHGQEGKKGRTKMKGLIISIAAAALLLTTAIAGYSLTAGDGATIYTADCASCHGAHADATIDPMVKIANVAQINRAFRLHTSMKSSILHTNMGVTGAGLKGQFTVKQKNAIVADLKLYHGEDLYTQKFTDPSQSTWNCSNVICHGPYDNSNVSGTTYGKILKSFNKRKSTMAALKSKYKLSELQLIAKAMAVAPAFSGGGTPSVDGSTLYYMDCMPCHNGPISQIIDPSNTTRSSVDIQQVYNAGSALAGATLISTAINSNAGNGTTLGGMGTQVLMNLSPAEIQSIATAIQTNELPGNASIYSSASCFGTGTGPTNHCHQGFVNPPYPN